MVGTKLLSLSSTVSLHELRERENAPLSLSLPNEFSSPEMMKEKPKPLANVTDIYSWAATSVYVLSGKMEWVRERERENGREREEEEQEEEGKNILSVLDSLSLSLSLPDELSSLLSECLDDDVFSRPRDISLLISNLIDIRNDIVNGEREKKREREREREEEKENEKEKEKEKERERENEEVDDLVDVTEDVHFVPLRTRHAGTLLLFKALSLYSSRSQSHFSLSQRSHDLNFTHDALSLSSYLTSRKKAVKNGIVKSIRVLSDFKFDLSINPGIFQEPLKILNLALYYPKNKIQAHSILATHAAVHTETMFAKGLEEDAK